jgi:hypothetical protein
MTDEQGVVRRISWRDLFPWLMLFRTFRIAIAPELLALATLAVLIAPLGWGLADFVFRPQIGAARGVVLDLPADAPPEMRQAVAEQRRAAHWRQRIPRAENSQLAAWLPAAARAWLPAAETAVLSAYFDLSEPLARFFNLRMGVRETAYYAFGLLWTLALWAFVGAVVTRKAVVQLASDSAPGVQANFRYAVNRYLWYFLTPLYPLLGILLLAIPIAILGLPIRLSPGVGSVIAGLAWILVAAAGLAAAWLFAGLIFGWPLMWPTISAERDGDPFEAFSRSYSYVYGKPLHYFFYVVVAAMFGALCWAVVAVAISLVREFGFWALSWGGGADDVSLIRQQAMDFAAGIRVPNPANRSLTVGTSLIGLVVALLHSVGAAFRYTFFFTAASAIYLLLRYDVDEKEMDEVYVEADGPRDNGVAEAPVATTAPSEATPA